MSKGEVVSRDLQWKLDRRLKRQKVFQAVISELKKEKKLKLEKFFHQNCHLVCGSGVERVSFAVSTVW